MPTYAYRCKDCGHAFDAVQAFTDDALTECPACGGVLRKQYGSVGVSFKGSGFYRTDSRSGTGSAGGSTSDSAAGSSTSSASAAAD
ncbi:FmdB family zinc ribbon protein [Micrococcus luteus]|uniref:FmdB family zinc ribbon protein n=1 Tax=Micrococcus luteus TaxID=1270 RepID=UPI003916DB86|nr:FmdB family transcriptional regulator [Micrococcus luteus]